MCRLRQSYVETHEKQIVFGNGVAWADVEADSCMFLFISSVCNLVNICTILFLYVVSLSYRTQRVV